MAIALVNHGVISGSGAVTTGSIDTTGANFLIIGLAISDPKDPTPTDSKGNTWTQLTSYTQTNVRVRIWYSIPSSVGTGHTFSVAGTNNFVTLFASAWSGVAQTTPADQQSGSNGFVSTLQPGSITPTQDNELVYSIVGINSSGTPISIDSGFTETGDETNFLASNYYGGCVAYKVQTTAAAVNPTWTRTNTNGTATSQVSFKAAAGNSPSLSPSSSASPSLSPSASLSPSSSSSPSLSPSSSASPSLSPSASLSPSSSASPSLSPSASLSPSSSSSPSLSPSASLSPSSSASPSLSPSASLSPSSSGSPSLSPSASLSPSSSNSPSLSPSSSGSPSLSPSSSGSPSLSPSASLSPSSSGSPSLSPSSSSSPSLSPSSSLSPSASLSPSSSSSPSLSPSPSAASDSGFFGLM